MKYKKLVFSLLEATEKKKMEKEAINIKNMHLKNQQINEQLTLLINYRKEYLEKIYDQMMLGMCINKWTHDNDFISILQKIIQDNINQIEKNKKTIEKSFKRWSNNQIQLKVWKNLNIKNKKQILKIKNIKTETINDTYIQLNFFKKG